ncbi:MAG TPA: hypothetical protein VIK01_01735 [Polyangiaceae bacterium]
MSSPIVIHVLRPYANEDEYLAHERSSIDSKSMLLIDQPALPADTAIVFDVQLANGHKPIRAEGKVIGYADASANSPAGLRVRFKRFGAATKAFIDRAISAPVIAALPVIAAPSAAPSEVAVSAGAPPATAPASSEASGIHRKVLPVSVPRDRDALLARLRGRKAG